MNTPPLFDGDGFYICKERLETFIKVNDFESGIFQKKNGMFIPTFSFNDEVVSKLDFDWNEKDLRKFKYGFKSQTHFDKLFNFQCFLLCFYL